MKKMLLCLMLPIVSASVFAQTACPCGKETYRKFDFWIGEWNVYAKNGNKAGDSKISLILDSCIILEEWTSAANKNAFTYKGKSFNTFNARTGQWQQTWVDNVTGSTEFLKGKADSDKIVFKTEPFAYSKDTMAVRRLSFFKISKDKVRQFAEISKDNGNTWSIEYDLEYRRRASDAVSIADTVLRRMEAGYNTSDYSKIADCYAQKGKVIGPNVLIDGKEKLVDYWKKITALGGTWKLTNEESQQINDHTIWQKGVSVTTDKNNKEHKVNFTLVIIFEDGNWKILQDAYWLPVNN